MMSSNGPYTKVAVITGGASGLGLGVATQLAHRGDWFVHILDLDEKRGRAASQALGSSSECHRVNVADYASLATIFDSIFEQHRRIDFVFANAGIVDNVDFYAPQECSGPPSAPNMLTIDIDLNAVVNSTYLAMHYFRRSPQDTKRNIVMTASVGSLYPCFAIPLYTGAKHGVLGFMRAIAPRLNKEGIRTNAICPGVVATNLMTDDDFEHYPSDYFTPLEAVTYTVLQVVDNQDMEDATGVKLCGDDVFGKAIEINVRNIYFRAQPDWCDSVMPLVMAATDR
ncbi:hypothetical protein C7974DRAFT_453487 [Boeremia exigua]|uniref:uncharacterized protein n=1 Tax=Boeremia exigua TaxID=749465 RepID=UPI001E8DF13F|nr:uncharacterized protein C7974DRAFT_453487 [Boeremia exigua]KAH6628987.1 hypothetical protein C7974DRAFT_453487 [Boeremia exigua]